MVTFKQSGSFNNLERFLRANRNAKIMSVMKSYGQSGVNLLAANTPANSGLTASSWGYEISHNSAGYAISFTNTNVNDGIPIAILIQYGHGTGTGGYVVGRDYINPALQPIFDAIADKVWKEVAVNA